MLRFKVYCGAYLRKKPFRLRIPYDATWKGITEALIHEFFEMFLPDLFAELDFDFIPRFVEQEVRARIKGRKLQFVDKLVLVRLRSGEMRLVLVHIEFESHPRNIPKRMFDYYCLIKDLDGATLFPDLVPATTTKSENRSRKTSTDFDITSLVVYVGNHVPKDHDRYEVNAFGTSNVFRFNTYIVRDQNEEALKANPNPFAIVVLATKYVNETRNDPRKRLSLKEKVYQLAAERGLTRKQADALLMFIDEILCLPIHLERKFNQSISTLPPNPNAMYITERSLLLADAITKANFGYSYTEREAVINQTLAQKDSALAQKDSALAQKEAALAQKDSVLAQKDSALAQKDSVITKSIVRLYTERRMSIADIAALMDITPEFVAETISSANV